jgi:DNA-binding SARP family transcriptional activator
VLALLLLARGRVVSVDELVEGLWGEAAPETAVKALQGYVSQLRRSVGNDRILTRPPGYAFRLGEGELDLDRCEQLAADGRRLLASGEPEVAADRLRAALALWRGAPLAEFDTERFAHEARPRLEELRAALLEDRIEADLRCGRHASLISELQAVHAAEPFRERVCEQLMLALYRSGRQAEALDAYRLMRDRLVEELGIEPGPRVQSLQRRMLQHDPTLQIPEASVAPAATPGSSARERDRRLVAAAVAVALAVLGAVAVAALALGGNGDDAVAPEPGGAAFVVKLENFLSQSRAGRREVHEAIDLASRCELARKEALARLGRVQRNRQSLLQQVAALSVPETDEALRASDLLQQAIHASIAADWSYRDWLRNRPGCGVDPDDPALAEARAADLKATRAKQRFVAAFNPLARRYDARTWQPSEF